MATIKDHIAAIRTTFGTTEPPVIYCRTKWAAFNWTPIGTATMPVLARDTDAKKGKR